MTVLGPSLPDRPFRGLWSLWELWEMVAKFDAGGLFAAIVGLSNMGHSVPVGPGLNTALVIPPENLANAKDHINTICEELGKIDLPTTLASAKELKKVIDNEIKIEKLEARENIPEGEYAILLPVVLGRYRHYAQDLVNRFKDEMTSRLVFTIPHSRASYFEATAPLFGDPVFNAFPSANDDIAEAGSCLALGRGTACVMHLNRALECGLAALAKAVGVTKQNDWGGYIREIGRELDARTKVAGARSDDEQFYAESVANFDRLRRAYRNPTMHPEKTYSQDRAEEIYLATKSFMDHLAGRLSE
jgi:hypothetical protein